MTTISKTPLNDSAATAMLMWPRKPSQHYRFWEERHPSNLPSPSWQGSPAAEADTSFATLAFVTLLHNQHCWSPGAAPALQAVYKTPLISTPLCPDAPHWATNTQQQGEVLSRKCVKKHHKRNIRKLPFITYFSWFCEIRIHTWNFSSINRTFK